MCLRPAWSTWYVPGQLRLCNERSCLKQQTDNNSNNNKNHLCEIQMNRLATILTAFLSFVFCFFLRFLFCICFCLRICMHVHTMHTETCGGQKRASVSLKLQTHSDMGAGVQSPIFCESSKLSELLSLSGILLVITKYEPHELAWLSLHLEYRMLPNESWATVSIDFPERTLSFVFVPGVLTVLKMTW